MYKYESKLNNIYNNDHNQNTYQGSNASLEETKKINNPDVTESTNKEPVPAKNNSKIFLIILLLVIFLISLLKGTIIEVLLSFTPPNNNYNSL